MEAFACVSPTQDSVSWPHREPHGMRCSQRRYSQLHMVGSFARLISMGRRLPFFNLDCSNPL
eukprot:4323247-Pyramimonas_sp.AAC.1